MKKQETTEFKKRLLALQARVKGDVEQLTDEALQHGGEDLRNPTHIAERGTETYDQDFSLRVVENDRELLEEIDAALDRIQQGTYGICEACRAEGRPASRSKIPKARLRAIPFARNCVDCERKREELSA